MTLAIITSSFWLSEHAAAAGGPNPAIACMRACTEAAADKSNSQLAEQGLAEVYAAAQSGGHCRRH